MSTGRTAADLFFLARGGSAHICTFNGHPTVGGVFYGFSDALHPARAGRQARRFGSPGGRVQPVFPAAGQRAGPGPAAQPAPDDSEGVQDLVDWREDAPYG